MPIKFFAVPALDPGDIEHDMNRFVRSHRVVTIDRKLVTVNERPVWCLAVEYVENGVPNQSNGGTVGGNFQRPRIDYRETLAPADFAVFSKLRDVRKQISEQEGIPVFAVFTNEQLAAVAQKRPQTKTALQEIEGVGAGKSTRYGERLLEVLQTFPSAEPVAVVPTPAEAPFAAATP